MDILKIMGLPEGYCTRHTDMPNHLQTKAKTLCWEYNQTAPTETEKRAFRHLPSPDIYRAVFPL